MITETRRKVTYECSNDAGDQAATPPSSSSQRVGVPVALARVDRSGSDEGDEQVEEDDWTSQLTRPADTIIIISWDHGLGCGGCGFFFCGMVRRGAGHGISSFGGGKCGMDDPCLIVSKRVLCFGEGDEGQ
jgi:hypothetical protein